MAIATRWVLKYLTDLKKTNKQKLNSKSAAEKAEQLLNLYHRSPKRLRNCQHQLPLEVWRMRCMKKLLKTGGWIKFCFKMQLSHQILSLFHPAGRFLFCHPGREEVYFLDRLHIPRLGIFGEFEGKKKSYCQIERFHKILCTKCSVLCNTLSSLWSQNTRNVAYTFFNTLDGSSVQNSNGPTEKTLRCTSVFSSRYSPVTSFIEVKPKVDSVHST